MRDYEIRILNNRKSPTAFVEMMESSDAAAIRAAERIAGGRAVEVWRDIDCVYRSVQPQ
ncbi:MAG TPA: hypothetical protein VG501_12110 [Rhizomicrobium sp.]|nr:hypothetical protein [Rhizomicrobium sp.]HWC64362.1 hypothetical protein [Rhizomicrobium sp.]